MEGGLSAAIKLTEDIEVERRRRLGAVSKAGDLAKAQSIIDEVAVENGVTVHSILSPSRFQYVVGPRWEAMRRMRDELDMTLETIGKMVNRDHSTVVHGLRMVESA